jgi:hypothetical protein
VRRVIYLHKRGTVIKEPRIWLQDGLCATLYVVKSDSAIKSSGQFRCRCVIIISDLRTAVGRPQVEQVGVHWDEEYELHINDLAARPSNSGPIIRIWIPPEINPHSMECIGNSLTGSSLIGCKPSIRRSVRAREPESEGIPINSRRLSLSPNWVKLPLLQLPREQEIWRKV